MRDREPDNAPHEGQPVDGGIYEEPRIGSGPRDGGAGDGSDVAWTGGEGGPQREGERSAAPKTASDQGEAGAGVGTTQGSV